MDLAALSTGRHGFWRARLLMAKIRDEFQVHPDGWSRWVYPATDGYKFVCCDCGLVHDVEFRVTDSYDRVEFRVRRNNRSTAQVRRHMEG
jgi:hypothetical protein